jgi:hypothetical protein
MKKVIILASVFFGINTMAQIELKESNFATKGALERMSSAAANSTVDLNTTKSNNRRVQTNISIRSYC